MRPTSVENQLNYLTEVNPKELTQRQQLLSYMALYEPEEFIMIVRGPVYVHGAVCYFTKTWSQVLETNYRYIHIVLVPMCDIFFT